MGVNLKALGDISLLKGVIPVIFDFFFAKTAMSLSNLIEKIKKYIPNCLESLLLLRNCSFLCFSVALSEINLKQILIDEKFTLFEISLMNCHISWLDLFQEGCLRQ